MMRIKVAFAFLVGALLLYLALRGVELGQLWEVFKGVKWGELTAALVLVTLSPLVRAWRWNKLLGKAAPRFHQLVKAIATGQTLNFVLPFRSRDVARVFMVGGKKLETAGTVAVEKMIDALFFAAICVTLPLLWQVPEWLEAPRIWAVGLGTVALVTVIFLQWKTKKYAKITPASWVILLGSTAFLWASGVLVNWFVLTALRVETSFLASLVFLVILTAGVAVPSTPGKVGVFQYLIVLALGLFAIVRAEALAVGLYCTWSFFPVAAIAGGLSVKANQLS